MRIVGVLVAYNPKIDTLINNIESYIDDLESLIIVNNSSYSLEEKIYKNYIKNESNCSGIKKIEDNF